MKLPNGISFHPTVQQRTSCDSLTDSQTTLGNICHNMWNHFQHISGASDWYWYCQSTLARCKTGTNQFFSYNTNNNQSAGQYRCQRKEAPCGSACQLHPVVPASAAGHDAGLWWDCLAGSADHHTLPSLQTHQTSSRHSAPSHAAKHAADHRAHRSGRTLLRTENALPFQPTKHNVDYTTEAINKNKISFKQQS